MSAALAMSPLKLSLFPFEAKVAGASGVAG